MIIESPEQLKINNISGDFDSIEAGMDNSSLPFILEMLSKNFYSNPIGSICREITSNCFDSHIEANVDDAVVIKIDEDDEGDYISFNDFGVGLSPERIKSVYMKYFTSTKRLTNDQIGGFGLGSKTPLAYTDYFYINTTVDKIKYNYLFSKGATIPTLNLLNEESTEDKNGTEIRIYIKNNNDKHTFIDELKSQLCYFDNVYFEGCGIDNEYCIYENDLFKFRNKDQYSEEMHICFGKVSYPIDWTIIDVKPVGVPVGVKFSIQELVVTPNREALRYTDEVKELVRKRVHETIELLKELYISQQNISDDFFEWYKDRRSRRYITFGNKEFDPDILYLKEFDHLGKKCQLRILEENNLSEDILGNDIFSSLYYISDTIEDGKIKKFNKSGNITEMLISGKSLIFSENSNYSGVKNYYHRRGLILRKNNIKLIFKRDFIQKTELTKEIKDHINKPSNDPYNYSYEVKYFNLGYAKRIYNLINYLRSQFQQKVKDYHVELTQKDKDDYIAFQNKYDLNIKRKLEGKIFYTGISCSDGEWYIDTNIYSRGKVVEYSINNYKGVVIYGFLEDRKALEKAVTFMYLNPNFRHLDSYRNFDGYLNSKACKIIRIAKQNEKYFKNRPNMIHVKELYGDNPLFRRLASSYRIALIFEDYLRNYSNMNSEDFIIKMTKINSIIGDNLLYLHNYYIKFTNNEDIKYSQFIRKDLKKEIIDLAEKFKLYDPLVEQKIKQVEDWFEGIELLKHIEINNDTLPYILKYIREKKKKLNLEYYCKIVEPEKFGIQLEFEWEPKEPITKFKLITNAA